MGRAIILGFDVGATNTRAAVGVLVNGSVRPHPAFEGSLTTEVGSKRSLYDFVVSVLRVLEDTDTLEAAAFAVAGPVEAEGRQARMTNWDEASPIMLDELVALGLPDGRTTIVNDLFAGARGLTSWLGQRRGPDELVPLLGDPSAAGSGRGHLVFIAPGTGLGAAGIVRTRDRFMPVACEVQHTLLPGFDEDARQVIDQLAEGPSGRPSWEDVASGVGLTRTYLAYCTLRKQRPHAVEGDGGSRAVAEAALAGADEAAVATLELYYKVIGRFAQMLALTFRPCEAVFIGGASTSKNRAFIERSALAREFVANRVQARLLEATPLGLVLEEVNLEGALAEAAELAKQAVPV